MGLLTWQEFDMMSLKELNRAKVDRVREIQIINYLFNKKVDEEGLSEEEEKMLCDFENKRINEIKPLKEEAKEKK